MPGDFGQTASADSRRDRLPVRFHAAQRVIVYTWLNDEDSKRAYGSDDGAYRVFRKMLAGGHPPDDWDSLFKEARRASKRLAAIGKAGD